MYVLVVVPRLTGGGAEFVARTWISHLAERGYRVVVCTTNSDTRPPEMPAHVEHRPLRRTRLPFGQVRELRSILQRELPDVTLSLQAHPNLVLLLAAATLRDSRPPVVVSERNFVTPGLRGASRSHRLKVLLAKALYRRADRMVAISHPVAAEMISAFGVRQDRCVVVPNPALAKLDTVRPVPRRSTDGSVTVVLPCRLVQQKRPRVAVDVVRVLRERGLDARLQVFGDGPLRGDVEAAASRQRVPLAFSGWQERWFDSCPDDAVVLLTSSREGFGNVLVEAAASGVPSAASAVALGVADAVVPGITGVLAPSLTPQALADAVTEARSCSFDGADVWLRQFSSESSGARLERVLEAVAR